MKKIQCFGKILVVTAIVFLLVGCSNQKSLVGIWEYYDGEKTRNDISYIFNKNNTGKYIFFNNISEFTYENDDKIIKIKVDGSSDVSEFLYTIDEGILNIEYSGGENTKYKKK